MHSRLVAAIEAVLEAHTGAPASLVGASSLSGGCIHQAQEIVTQDGRSFFCKVGPARPRDLLQREYEGLAALGETRALRVVRPLAFRVQPELESQFLITEFIQPGKRKPGFFRNFGRGLALMHRQLSGRRYGFHHDNYLGRTPQPNPWMSDWREFWRRHRLEFQLEQSLQNGHRDPELHRLGQELGAQIPERLGTSPEPPCLLHGDLWGGNFLVDRGGNAVLIDPAVYYGDREAELAMCRLFGGFDQTFYEAYQETWPLRPGSARRIEIYQLYHLLNHLNLFGSAYLAGCLSLLRRILG